MNLSRCQDQKGRTLDESYTAGDGADEISRKRCAAMRDLIERIRALPGQPRVYGLTSHVRLCLLAKDAYTSPWFVIAAAADTRNYYIEDLMPDHAPPWAGAYVRGEARTEDAAWR
jgi:hypothetical protein